MVNMLPGMNGGSKHMWLGLHRGEVMAYYTRHGEEATREKYNIKKDATWRNFLGSQQVGNKTMTEADRLNARQEICEVGLQETRREVRELKEHYSRFVPHLAEELTKKFFIPLMSGKLELPPELEYKPGPDPLDITDFPRKLAE